MCRYKKFKLDFYFRQLRDFTTIKEICSVIVSWLLKMAHKSLNMEHLSRSIPQWHKIKWQMPSTTYLVNKNINKSIIFAVYDYITNKNDA